MSLMKKIIIGWLTLSVISGAWALITGNTSEEAMITNALVDKCEDAIEDNEDLITVRLNEMGYRTGQNLDVEYDNDIAPMLETKRGMHQLFITCQQKLVSNDKSLEPWTVVVIEVENDSGDITSRVTDYDIYDNQEKLWWSEL